MASTTGNGQPAIRIRGARVHNLRNIDVDIPRNQLVVITGPSGSGKSSLAFDTLYAEGKRQYIESLSVYARQFLDQVSRPDVDWMDGLQPTLCIDQRPGTQNPRSTVATVTEVYDYLRLLMARLGAPSCYQCGKSIEQQTVDQITTRLSRLAEGTKVMILAPMVRGRKGTHKEIFSRIRKAGFVRVRVNGCVCELDDVPPLKPQKNHHIDAVIDRVIMRENIASRLAESVEVAVEHGDGLMSYCFLDESEPPPADWDSDESGPWQPVWHDQLCSTQYACSDCGISYEELEPRTFSFNSPYGACRICEGLGRLDSFDPELFIPDRTLSFATDALLTWKHAPAATRKKQQSATEKFLASIDVAWSTPLDELPLSAWNQLLRGDDCGWPGLLLLLKKESATSTSRRRQTELAKFRGEVICHGCDGSRLRNEAMGVRFAGRNVAQITALSIADALEFFSTLTLCGEHETAIGTPLIDAIRKRLTFLIKVGLDYLTLDRGADTLSGGEFQRVRLATSIGSGLVGVCYVLDEPSIGLHHRDNERLNASLRNLKQQGNTVVVVEHDHAVMRTADRLIDMGPAAGSAGGMVVAQGSPDEIAANENSLTGQYLSGKKKIPIPIRRKLSKSRSLMIQAASMHNLREIDVRIPLGAFVCVSGVSGSGKSSLINETLAPAMLRHFGRTSATPGPFRGLRGVQHIDMVVQIDQSPIGRSPRSNPATYTGVFDDIRKVFSETRDAKQRGFRLGRFSFNNKEGRCEPCKGNGVQRIEMSFLPDLDVICDQCGGARFNRQTLQVKYRGKSIADVLNMRVAEAAEFFQNFANIARVIQSMERVGLGYLPLGQRSTTLSGGEAQRIKLATELSRVDSGKTLYLLDEPTTGLHFDDIRRLLDVLQGLVEKGNTVLVIEHNLDVIKSADWVIDLGPEGGAGGGQLVAEGTPEQIAKVDASHTGRCLRTVLDGTP